MSVTVFATSAYARTAKRLLSEEERYAMEASIAANPEAHPVIPASGGLRKARWPRSGKGKRGGVRAIFYFWRPRANSACCFSMPRPTRRT